MSVRDGDVIALSCDNGSGGRFWLDGRTLSNDVHLSPTTKIPPYSGAWWLVHSASGESDEFYLECLGHLRGNHWLGGDSKSGKANLEADATVDKAKTVWKVSQSGDNQVTICLAGSGNKKWLTGFGRSKAVKLEDSKSPVDGKTVWTPESIDITTMKRDAGNTEPATVPHQFIAALKSFSMDRFRRLHSAHWSHAKILEGFRAGAAAASDDIRVVHSHVEFGGSGGPYDGCVRPVWYVVTPPGLWDAFMNHWQGYRAAYTTSNKIGDRFNRKIIDALTPQLIREWGNEVPEDKRTLFQKDDGDYARASQLDSSLGDHNQVLPWFLDEEGAKIWNYLKVTSTTNYVLDIQMNVGSWPEKATEATAILDQIARRPDGFNALAKSEDSSDERKELDELSKLSGINSFQDLLKAHSVHRETLRKIFKEKKTSYKALFGVRCFEPLPDEARTGSDQPKGLFIVNGSFYKSGAVKGAWKGPVKDRGKEIREWGWT